MKITYDLTVLPDKNRGHAAKSEEVQSVIAFLATAKKNMVIEYDEGPDPKQICRKRYEAIWNYRKNNKLEDIFDIYRAGNKIVIVKTKKPRGRDAGLNA